MLSVVFWSVVVIVMLSIFVYGLFKIAELFDDVINPWIGYNIRKCLARIKQRRGSEKHVIELDYDEFTDVWGWNR